MGNRLENKIFELGTWIWGKNTIPNYLYKEMGLNEGGMSFRRKRVRPSDIVKKQRLEHLLHCLRDNGMMRQLTVGLVCAPAEIGDEHRMTEGIKIDFGSSVRQGDPDDEFDVRNRAFANLNELMPQGLITSLVEEANDGTGAARKRYFCYVRRHPEPRLEEVRRVR